jgi:hypothetical protein
MILLAAGCIGTRSAMPRPSDDVRQILAAVGDTVIRARPGGASLYVADSVTLRAFASAADKAGTVLVLAPAQVWCEDHAESGRAVGTVVALRLDSVVGERALVHWAATCLKTARDEARASAVGESGVYEVVRHLGGWRVSRALLHFAH